MRLVILLAAWSLVVRDYQIRFRRTFFGVVWFLMPLFALISMSLFFGKNLDFYSKGQEKNYFIQLLVGLIFWQLLADSWLEPMRLARRNNAMLRSVVFDASILIVAGTLSALVAFAIKLPIMILAIIWFKIPFAVSLASLPVAILSLLFAGATMACFTLPLSLALLDVRYAMPFIQYALLLATPIFYSTPDSGPVAWINQINPLSYLIPQFRDIFIGVFPDIIAVLLTLIVLLGFFVLGMLYFHAKFRLAIAYIGH